MVYCTKCGAKNPDDAKVCSQCGASLYPGAPPTRRYERRKHEEECFGIPRGGTIVGLGIGIIIVLAGISFLISELYNIEIPWWAFGVIMLGVLIIIGALYGLRRY
jgi:uncharacterized membrane protein YvbJ